MKKKYYMYVGMLGILLSLIWVILVRTQPYSDFQYYNELAKQIANGGVWGNTYTSVGYSILLGFVYKIFGGSLIVAKLFNIVLTVLNYFILYKVLNKVNINEKKRKIIYTIFVIFPNNIFYNSITGTEIIFTTVLLLITLIYFSDIKYKYIMLGILTAASAMIKPFFILFFFAVFILELVIKKRLLNALKHGILILVISMICLAPWIYRNTKVMGQLTFISNNSGIVLYINNNSQNHYGLWMDANNVENSIVKKKSYIKANETQKNKMLSTAAKKWIISHPKQFIVLGFKRILNTYFSCSDISYSLYGAGLSTNVQLILGILANDIKIIVFALAVISIIICSIKTIYNLIAKNSLKAYDIYGLILFYMFTSVYSVTEGQPRYSFPLIFIAIYFFCNALESAILFIKSNRGRKLAYKKSF
ncbi:glycosyltransferase family 39 protein [Clostridium felsineum]|uniref:Uncharacterized protein n=1 Tax=Clostridium felsineum TaxID=36839 RepID=A0A1S8LZT8_9CLOT|nr:glycosyltransferase family 39 protein [Clostridium felsineum]URZ09178.1 hypothetical protein CLROS_045940 [Clostridium felsineum]URZ13864.1 hypothetical protein CROST_046420 [Clostridium felsineum]